MVSFAAVIRGCWSYWDVDGWLKMGCICGCDEDQG
jgi:hypothetical protein